MNQRIVELDDDAAIAAVLEEDPHWAAYALCDMEQPYRANACFVGALHNGRARTIVLLYRLPGFTVLSVCGDADGVAAFVESDYPLPERPFLMVRPGDLAALERRYQHEALDHMLRMVLNTSDLRSESESGIETVALTMDDLPALEALYGTETAFSPEMLQYGIFYGVFSGGELVAAAGTHTIARRRAIGVIGSVLTRPDYRGRGLATATAGAVAWALARAGIRVLALNVRADNAPALAVYRRLGFSAGREFYEGFATLRTLR